MQIGRQMRYVLRRLASRAKGLVGRLIQLLPNHIQVRIWRLLWEAASRSRPEPALRMLLQAESELGLILDRLAIEYDGGVHVKHRLTHYHDFFVNRVRSGDSVLDVGCGNGAVTWDIAEKSGARDVTGIDMNPLNINMAMQRFSHPKVTYILGNALKEIPASHYQTVILSNVVEHLANRTEFLRQLVEGVRPDRILVRVPVFERDWRVPLRKELGLDWRCDDTHETEYTNESFLEEMTAAGLRVMHQEVRWGEIWAEVVPG